MTPQESVNYSEMAEWLSFHKAMPDRVLLDLLQPYIPIEIDRGKGVVVIYCGRSDVGGLRRKLEAWARTQEERLREMRAASSRDRFRKYCLSLGLQEPPAEFYR